MAETNSRFSRRTLALFWCLTVGVIIGILLYWEQIAVLYVLATIGLVVLLLIVAFANLEKVGRENIEGFSSKNE